MAVSRFAQRNTGGGARQAPTAPLISR